MTTSPIRIAGDGGDEIEAYPAGPAQPARRGGVLAVRHKSGYDRATTEIVHRFAELGYDGVCPNLAVIQGALASAPAELTA